MSLLVPTLIVIGQLEVAESLQIKEVNSQTIQQMLRRLGESMNEILQRLNFLYALRLMFTQNDINCIDDLLSVCCVKEMATNQDYKEMILVNYNTFLRQPDEPILEAVDKVFYDEIVKVVPNLTDCIDHWIKTRENIVAEMTIVSLLRHLLDNNASRRLFVKSMKIMGLDIDHDDEKV